MLGAETDRKQQGNVSAMKNLEVETDKQGHMYSRGLYSNVKR